MRDIVSVIEQCYSVESGAEDWLQRVTTAAAGLTPIENQLAGMVFDAREGVATLPQVHAVGLDGFGADGVRALTSPRDRAQSRRMFTTAPIVAFASKVKGHPAFSGEQAGSKNVLAQFGIDDLVGVRAIAEPDRGAVLSFALRSDTPLSQRDIAMWQRVATHVGTGLRLLYRMEGAPLAPDAILSPSGKIEHAEASAKESGVRAQITDAARAIEKARGKLRRADPDEALALWRCLVQGTWTLIDTFDSDGRRYVVAHRNERSSTSSSPSFGSTLTPREIDVLARLAEGYSNKLIAYELGLTLSTVATLLKRAKTKLGASSRAELIVLAHATILR